MANFLTTILYVILFSPLSFIPSVIASISQNGAEDKIDATELATLGKAAPKLDKKILTLASHAYNHALETNKVKNPYLTVIDYHLPSSQKRMWIFDVDNDKLIYNTYVAHGKNSGSLYAKHFSNRNQSKQSSLGTYITKSTYYGGKGLSLNLQGMEPGFNDNAYDRRVVIHGAWYVEPKFVQQSGRAGRSWGCPAIGKSLAKPVINTIKEGSVVFAYYPDSQYLNHSDFVA